MTQRRSFADIFVCLKRCTCSWLKLIAHIKNFCRHTALQVCVVITTHHSSSRCSLYTNSLLPSVPSLSFFSLFLSLYSFSPSLPPSLSLSRWSWSRRRLREVTDFTRQTLRSLQKICGSHGNRMKVQRTPPLTRSHLQDPQLMKNIQFSPENEVTSLTL